jgi:osmotically-inducible protein OsmY
MRLSLHTIVALVLLVPLAACDIARQPEEDAVKDFRSAVNPPKAVTEQADADAALRHEVERALEQSAEVKPKRVQIEAADGVVTLNGEVARPEQRDRAALLTLSLEGVRGVVNNLVVTSGAS